MKLLNSKPSIKLVLVVAAVGLAAVACTSSEKESKGKTPATAEEETEVIDSNMPEREGALLPRKDSLALAKLYKEYEKAAQDLYEHTEIFGDEYDRKLAKIKTDFEASLTGNPNYAPVVELRNLLIAYQKDMRKDEEHKYDVDLKLDEDMPEEFVTHEKDMYFQKKWDEKLMKLLQEHPGFIECPQYMFDEVFDGGVGVATSTDGRVRYISYLSGEWRGLASITCIRQYRTDSGQNVVSLVENGDSWGGVDEVHTLAVDGKTVYLLRKTHNEGYFYIAYCAEAIEGEKITHPMIFDTENKKGPYVLYSLKGPQKDWVAKYDEKTKTIYMRVTDEEHNYHLNDTYATYTFDGKMFKPSGQHRE